MKAFSSLNALNFLGKGRHRKTYDLGKFVLKIPHNPAGEHANEMEARLYRRYGRKPDQNGIVFARCKLLKNGWLIMEKVEPLVYHDPRMPVWANYIDCSQVGKARDGKIVAYDYSENY